MQNQLPRQSSEDLARYRRKAMAARSRYAAAKRALKSGGRSLESVLDDPGLRRIPVRDVIASMPGFGRRSALKLMGELGIAESRRVGGLGCRQRASLLGRRW